MRCQKSRRICLLMKTETIMSSFRFPHVLKALKAERFFCTRSKSIRLLVSSRHVIFSYNKYKLLAIIMALFRHVAYILSE